MIIKGSSRGQDRRDVRRLADHLLSGENESVEVVEISGVSAADLHGALTEMRMVAAGTRCRKCLYHASVNLDRAEVGTITPEHWIEAVDELARRLGMEGHQRVVVRHRKHGRDHVHAVFSRVDPVSLKVASDSHNYRTHEECSRALEARWNLRPVVGAHTKPADQPRPVASATGRRYRGVNVLLLGSSPRAWESGDPRWCSYEQARRNGWQVRAGQHGTAVYFFKRVETDAPEDGPQREGAQGRAYSVLRRYTVFNASQIEGIPAYMPPSVEDAPWREPEAVRKILDASGVVIRVGGDRAFYSPQTDHIQMPVAAAFTSPEAWSATALHELGHATSHPSRLDRDLGAGIRDRAREEMRAEIASAMMAGELGISSDLEQHSVYVESWLDALRRDKREVFRAAGDAQRIADWCLDLLPEFRLARQLEEAPAVSADMPTPTEPAAVEGYDSIGEALPDYVRDIVMPGGGVPADVADGGAPAYVPGRRI